MPLDRPIPAFYCCYLLRSTVRHGSVYVGSTPNPVRRLRQHNGLAKGGAVRTSRDGLRPWEMSCIVTGFPSHIAALQFEWAWQNPHLTLHIPSDSRLQHATQKKKSGRPKRPRHSTTSLLSNLHLLLRVPSFARWPLELRFFSKDVYKSWLRWCKTAAVPVRDTIAIIQDFPPEPTTELSEVEPTPTKEIPLLKAQGIAALAVDYADHKAHVEKAKDIIDFEMEGDCALCNEHMDHDAGVYTSCPNPACRSVTHLTCLSKHFLTTDDGAVLPITGACPSCKTNLRWVDVVKELSLRMRGEKELEKLLKVKQPRKRKVTTASQTCEDASDVEDEEVTDMEEEMEMINAFDLSDGDSDVDVDSAPLSKVIRASPSANAKPITRESIVIQDSEWDDAIKL